MENGHFLKPIYRTVSDSNFINKICPIFDRNKYSISSFCRFLPVFLLQQPKIWKNKSKSAKKSNNFCLLLKKSKWKCLKPSFLRSDSCLNGFSRKLKWYSIQKNHKSLKKACIWSLFASQTFKCPFLKPGNLLCFAATFSNDYSQHTEGRLRSKVIIGASLLVIISKSGNVH